jgi:hypothetical protein
MAELIRETASHVVIGMRLPRPTFERLCTGYPSQGQALRAVRLLFEDAVAVSLVGASVAVRAVGAAPLAAPPGETET